MNLKIDVHEAPHTADFNLTVQVYDHTGTGFVPMATLGTINVDDPNLGLRLRDMFQAFRMGMMYGERPLPLPDVVGNGYPEYPQVAGTDLPPRDDGIGDTAIQHHAR